MADGKAGAETRRRKKDGIEATAETAADAAHETIEAAREGAGAAADTARRQAGRLGDQVREAAQSLIHEQQERVADAVSGVADALRQTADTLQDREGAAMARYADRAAEQIDRLSESVRNQQLGDLIASAESFARRQPMLFLAGAVAAGFVVGRVLAQPSEEHPRSRASGMAASREEEPLAGYGAGMAGPA